MDTNECSLCRPGGFALTRQMFQFAGIEIPEAGAAETESTDPAVPLRVIDIGCGTGGTMRWLSEHFPDWQISGLDKNPDVHEPGWIETGCAEKLPYPDQTADIILMECSCSKAAERMSATSFSEDWRCAASACFWQRHRLHCWHFSRFR